MKPHWKFQVYLKVRLKNRSSSEKTCLIESNRIIEQTSGPLPRDTLEQEHKYVKTKNKHWFLFLNTLPNRTIPMNRKTRVRE